MTASAVGHWERPSGHQPSSENLIQVAKQLSVNLEWLATGCGEMRGHRSSGSEPSVISLSDEEEALIKRYQGLSSPSRALLAQFMEALAIPSGASQRTEAAKR